MTEPVRVDREGAVAVVTVDNPPVNALADSVIEALDAAAATLEGDEGVRAVVLTGAGEKAFLAGADLDEFAERLSQGEGIDAHVAATRRALGRWESLPQPVVAATHLPSTVFHFTVGAASPSGMDGSPMHW